MGFLLQIPTLNHRWIEDQFEIQVPELFMKVGRKFRRFITVLLGGLLVLDVNAQDGAAAQKNFTDMSIEDLMNIKVTSASKMEQTLRSVSSAITVITQEEIHRSGVRNLAEAMRLAPGVQVQQLSGHYYAITIRGFNNPNYDGSYGNKLLVLIDGRTLYSPFTSTVYWEVEDLMLDDVERIEIIRGPGGTLYGANAVNGVINIITKSADETLGSISTASVGNLDKDRIAIRHGWKAGKDASFRVYGKVGTDGHSLKEDGTQHLDGGSFSEFGFRGDVKKVGHGSLMVQGSYNKFGIYEDFINPSLVEPYFLLAQSKDLITRSHFLANWISDEKAGKQTTIQAYYDLLDYPYSINSSVGTTWDLSLQRKVSEKSGASTIFGGGYRYELNNSTPAQFQTLNPLNRKDTIANFFAQREVPIGVHGRLTFGAKVEHNTFTGFEVEPNVRYLRNVNDTQTLWASVSRAVRSPSQSELNEHSIKAVDPPAGPDALPTATVNFGNGQLTSEVLIANEIGYRWKASKSLSFDGAAFYNRYSNLIYQVAGTPYTGTEFGVPVNVIPINLKSGESGNTYGFEIVVRNKLASDTQIALSYGYVGQSLFSHGTDIAAPKHQIGARFSKSLRDNFDFDGMLYHYSAVSILGGAEYTKLDLRLGWKPSKSMELSLSGHDLFKSRQSTFAGYSYIPRTLDLHLSMHF